MKNLGLALLLGITGLLIYSCEPVEEKISGSGSINLHFSTDTVIFDTLLTARTSITKRLRIFNPSKKAVSISSIRLGKGESSPYSIIVNGKFGTEIEDEVLFGGDSLLVLVDVEIDPQDINLPYIVKDSVVVDWNGNSGHVKLVAWGQDANFINGEIICDQTWTADRPYVIYDGILVDSLCTLTIQPGARIYLDNEAAVFVKGTLKVLGDSSNRVVFRNTRFDENYKIAPGQWDAIYFLEGSKNNEIRYADLENGTQGLRIGTPDDDTDYDLVLANASIRHMSQTGIQSYTSDLLVENTEIFNCGNFTVVNALGGYYRYEHCTFSNIGSYFINEDPSFYFTDELEIEQNQFLYGDIDVLIRNSIIWGPNDEELFFEASGNANFTLEMSSNIIKSEQDFGTTNYTSTENDFPGFVDPFEFNFRLDSLSFARDKGEDLGYEFDVLGIPRDDKPDIGAHERVDR
ncbi:MAG: right-handed parallel beta-helix repeat-containing protein [Cyclobacteriaceae bacterium]